MPVNPQERPAGGIWPGLNGIFHVRLQTGFCRVLRGLTTTRASSPVFFEVTNKKFVSHLGRSDSTRYDEADIPVVRCENGIPRIINPGLTRRHRPSGRYAALARRGTREGHVPRVFGNVSHTKGSDLPPKPLGRSLGRQCGRKVRRRLGQTPPLERQSN